MSEANIGKITAFEMKPGHVYLISPDRQLTQAMHKALKNDWRDALEALPEDERPLVLVNAIPASVVEVVQPVKREMADEEREAFKAEWSRIHSCRQPQYEPFIVT